MPDLERFSISMEQDLLAKFDTLIASRGYPSRSEAVRDLVRRDLVGEAWADPKAQVVGAITLVYDHHAHDLAHVLADLQHKHTDRIVCATHVHLDAHNCLEVIIVRGRSRDVKHIAETLIAARGVKHGRVLATATGENL